MPCLFKHRDTASCTMGTFLDTCLLTGLKANNVNATLIPDHYSTGHHLAD